MWKWKTNLIEINYFYKLCNNKKNKAFDFQKFKTIRSFGKEIYSIYLLLGQQIKLKDDLDIS